ncbi:substrate-binding domain-containing protein [Pseudonocardia sp.]|uniref:sugar ABC transporter substrate-binding protein n=1 Tax=Pseudonocardia sp. TaxID=60912 RepID=UPI0031FC2CDA
MSQSRTPTWWLTLAAALSLVTSLVACSSSSTGSGGAGGASSGSDPKVIYAASALTIPFVVSVTDSMKKAAQAQGINLSVLDNKGDTGLTVSNARAAMVQKPALFVEYSTSPEVATQVNTLMKSSGIPVLDVQVQATDNAPFFGIDNVAVGAAGGTGVANAAKAKWGSTAPTAALVLNYLEGGPAQLSRGTAAASAITGVYPGISVQIADSKDDSSVATQTVSAFLTSHPGQKVLIWSHLDSYAIAAANAVRVANRGNDVLIGSTGGESSVVPYIKDHQIVGTTDLFPETWGPTILGLVKNMLAKQPVPPITRPQIKFVDAGTVDQNMGS